MAPASGLETGPDLGRITLPDTQWSLFLAKSNREQWEDLIQSYWRPVYRYLQRYWRIRQEEEAKDLTQEFFLRLLEDRTVERIAPQFGKLRHYIKACLDNFMRNVRRSAAAIKRGGRFRQVDVDLTEEPDPSTDLFDSEWRSSIVANALQALEQQYRNANQPAHLEIFGNYYRGQPESVRSLGLRLGLAEHTVDNILRHAKWRFRNLVIQKIRETVATQEDLEEELRALLRNTS